MSTGTWLPVLFFAYGLWFAGMMDSDGMVFAGALFGFAMGALWRLGSSLDALEKTINAFNQEREQNSVEVNKRY